MKRGVLDSGSGSAFTAEVRLLAVLILGAIFTAGCVGPKVADTGSVQSASQNGSPKPVLTPDFKPIGKVAMVNRQGRFVVITFPVGTVMEKDRKLNVYRDGLRVGVVKLTEMVRDLNTVGDLIAGDAEVNDEVREN